METAMGSGDFDAGTQHEAKRPPDGPAQILETHRSRQNQASIRRSTAT